MPSSSQAGGRLKRTVAEALTVAAGLLLLLAAVLATPGWFEQRFIGTFFFPRGMFEAAETCGRLALGGVGLALILVLRRRIGRLAADSSAAAMAAQAARIALALALGLGVGELGLRLRFPRSTEQPPPREEPLRRPDPTLGWVFTPSRTGRAAMAGRMVDYAFDAHGYRVSSLAAPVDPARPSLVFAGESIMTGFGLRWPETIPARAADALGLQGANLAVFAYGDDQTYLRLRQELPRFAHPVAVVTLFSPGLVFRDFNDDRPHLEPGMVWRPAVRRWRLEALLRFLSPYHSRGSIERTVGLVRSELAAEAGLARARGACALIVVPRFGPEDAVARRLREQILDAGRLPYVTAVMEPGWRLAGNPHPDARGAAAIAAAVVEALRRQAQTGPPPCREALAASSAPGAAAAGHAPLQAGGHGVR